MKTMLDGSMLGSHNSFYICCQKLVLAETLQLWRISSTFQTLFLEQIGMWLQRKADGSISIARRVSVSKVFLTVLVTAAPPTPLLVQTTLTAQVGTPAYGRAC